MTSCTRKNVNNGGWGSDDRGQKTEDRGQISDVGCQMSEDRGRRAEDRGQMSEVGGQRADVRWQMSEVRGRKAEDRSLTELTETTENNRLMLCGRLTEKEN